MGGATQAARAGLRDHLPYNSYMSMMGNKMNKRRTSPSRHVSSPSTTHHATWATEGTLRDATRRAHRRRWCDGSLHILVHVLLLLQLLLLLHLLLLELLRLHLLLLELLLLLLLLLHLLHPALVLDALVRPTCGISTKW